MRLIDADALKNELTSICSDKENDYNKAVKAFIKFIDNAPTVDVETQLLSAELHGIKIGYEEAQKKLIQQQGELVEEIVGELESRKDYGVEYAEAMENVIVILKAKFGIGEVDNVNTSTCNPQ